MVKTLLECTGWEGGVELVEWMFLNIRSGKEKRGKLWKTTHYAFILYRAQTPRCSAPHQRIYGHGDPEVSSIRHNKVYKNEAKPSKIWENERRGMRVIEKTNEKISHLSHMSIFETYICSYSPFYFFLDVSICFGVHFSWPCVAYLNVAEYAVR